LLSVSTKVYFYQEGKMITQRIGTEMGLMANRVKRKFRNGAHKMSGLQNNLTVKSKRCISQTDYLVHENAWKMIGFTAAFAVIACFFLARRYGPRLMGESDRLLVHESGEEREVKVKTRSGMDYLKALLPFALFLVRARKEAKCPEKVELKTA
jgi:ElaB/YqjD/DUF883 family membrane-anchored ribosome-binding protein